MHPWCHGESFVQIQPQARANKAHEELKRRSLWLRQNKQAPGFCCKAVINVEADDERRAALAIQSALAEKAIGIPIRVLTTLAQPYAEGLALVGVVLNP